MSTKEIVGTLTGIPIKLSSVAHVILWLQLCKLHLYDTGSIANVTGLWNPLTFKSSFTSSRDSAVHYICLLL